MEEVKITLIKSLIRSSKKQKTTAESLGLRKIGNETIQKRNPQTEGKINVIKHLIKVSSV